MARSSYHGLGELLPGSVPPAHPGLAPCLSFPVLAPPTYSLFKLSFFLMLFLQLGSTLLQKSLLLFSFLQKINSAHDNLLLQSLNQSPIILSLTGTQ